MFALSLVALLPVLFLALPGAVKGLLTSRASFQGRALQSGRLALGATREATHFFFQGSRVLAGGAL